MKNAVAILLLLASTLSQSDSLSALGWRGIVPLHSTRGDVERQLGPGGDGCKCRYHLDDLIVFFSYSSGDCKSGSEWNVPPNTVVWITVRPRIKPRLSDLNMDEDKFDKKPGGDIEGQIYYKREEQGLTMVVDHGMVDTFLYGPAVKDRDLS